MYINSTFPGVPALNNGTNPYQSSMLQLSLLSQMMSLMMSVFSLVSGMNSGAPMSAGNPGFGGSGGAFAGGATPASFLGSGGSPGSSPGSSQAGGSSPAPAVGDAKSVGGGFVAPVDNYRVSSRFGPRKAPTAGASSYHKGIDLAAPLNTPVRAAKAGRVTVSKDEATGYGKWIEVQHADGTKTRYAHLNSRDVQVGSQVQAGQVIGKMGSTGTSTGSHLHFEILDKSGKQINPEQVMKF